MFIMNIIAFLFLALIWGGSFVAIKFVIHNVDPFWSVFFRVLSAFLFVWGFFLVRGDDLKLPLKSMAKVLVCGLFAVSIPFVLLFWGEQYISAGMAGVLNGIVPMMALLLGRFVMKSNEDWQLNKVIGVACGIAGLVFIFFPKIELSGSNQELWGIIAVVFMSLAYAVASVYNRYVIYKDPNITYASNLVYQLGFSVISLIPLLFFGSFPSLDKLFAFETIAGILYLGVVSTGMGYLIYYHLLKFWSPVRATAVTYIVPVVALSSDFLINGNTLDWYEATGAVCIFFGVLVAQVNKESLNQIFKKIRKRKNKLVSPSKC